MARNAVVNGSSPSHRSPSSPKPDPARATSKGAASLTVPAKRAGKGAATGGQKGSGKGAAAGVRKGAEKGPEKSSTAHRAKGAKKTVGKGAGRKPAGSAASANPASRRALRSQGRRTMRKLLDASMEAFDQRGYHATRVNDVVEIAETSHGTFYLYFSNKEDLLRALVGEVAAEAAKLYTAMAEPPARHGDRQHLREWVDHYSSLWNRYGPLMRAWTDLAAIDPELSEQVRRTMSSMSDALAAQIRAYGPAEGIDPDAAAMAVLAMLDRFHYLRQFVGRPVDDVALDTLTTMVLRALFDEPVPADH